MDMIGKLRPLLADVNIFLDTNGFCKLVFSYQTTGVMSLIISFYYQMRSESPSPISDGIDTNFGPDRWIIWPLHNQTAAH
jgi:hypothetical protein